MPKNATRTRVNFVVLSWTYGGLALSQLLYSTSRLLPVNALQIIPYPVPERKQLNAHIVKTPGPFAGAGRFVFFCAYAIQINAGFPVSRGSLRLP